MSKREVAMNASWRHGDLLCPSCNAAGRHDVLKPGVCSKCGRATCFVCRGATPRDSSTTHDNQERFCAPKVKTR